MEMVRRSYKRCDMMEKDQLESDEKVFSEPICPYTQSKEDKSGLGFPKSKQRHHNYQHPKWRKKSIPKEEPWQGKLHQVAKTIANK